MSQEQGEVVVGSTPISYRVSRSERRRVVTLTVRWQDGVTVLAPRATSPERIEQIVRVKSAWLLEKLRQVDLYEAPLSRREYVAGESYQYLGRQYRLRLSTPELGDDVVVTKRGGYLDVIAPRPWQGEEHEERVRVALIRWYQEQGQRRLPERARLYAKRAGVSFSQVLVQEQSKRWGSCSQRGDLRFNWRLMMAPLVLIDYVVAHEVCHVLEPDHSAAFWRLLGAVLPDYAERRSRLKMQGPAFDL